MSAVSALIRRLPRRLGGSGECNYAVRRCLQTQKRLNLFQQLAVIPPTLIYSSSTQLGGESEREGEREIARARARDAAYGRYIIESTAAPGPSAVELLRTWLALYSNQGRVFSFPSDERKPMFHCWAISHGRHTKPRMGADFLSPFIKTVSELYLIRLKPCFSLPPPPSVFVELKSPSEAQTNRLITSTHTPPPPPPSPTVTIYAAHLKPPFQGRTAGNLKGHTDRILQRTETEQQLWKVGHLQALLPLQTLQHLLPRRHRKRGAWIRSVAWRTLFDIPKDMIVKSS